MLRVFQVLHSIRQQNLVPLAGVFLLSLSTMTSAYGWAKNGTAPSASIPVQSSAQQLMDNATRTELLPAVTLEPGQRIQVTPFRLQATNIHMALGEIDPSLIQESLLMQLQQKFEQYGYVVAETVMHTQSTKLQNQTATTAEPLKGANSTVQNDALAPPASSSTVMHTSLGTLTGEFKSITIEALTDTDGNNRTPALTINVSVAYSLLQDTPTGQPFFIKGNAEGLCVMHEKGKNTNATKQESYRSGFKIAMMQIAEQIVKNLSREDIHTPAAQSIN